MFSTEIPSIKSHKRSKELEITLSTVLNLFGPLQMFNFKS